MILHIAVARDELGNIVRAEFGENHLERFLEEIGQHIEPATMRHAHADFFDPVARAAMQNRIEDDHERLRALERKALLSDIAGVEENLERFRLEQESQKRDLHLDRSLMLRRARFEPVAHPIPDARILDVLKFRPDRVGINFLEPRDHLAQGHPFVVEKEFRRDLQIEVLLAEAKLAQGEERIFRPLVGQRIDPRDGVPERAIGVNQTVDTRLERTLARRPAPRAGRGCSAVSLRRIAEFKALEKGAPTAVHRLGILLPTAIVFLDQIEVAADRK